MDGYQIVDFVGKYEDLKTDWKYVANRLQISEELPLFPASNTQKEVSGTREQLQKLHWSRYYINDELIDTVLEVYKKDIDILGYDYIERQLRRLMIRKIHIF